MKIRILGSGTSSGVPRIGNDWGACDPNEPRNRRTRASVLVSTDTTRILVDTSPDMRAQLLAAEVDDVDAVIWTHDHADHCHGIDDLRQVMHARNGRPVRGLARPQTLERLQRRFGYVFHGRGGYPPVVAGEELPDAIRIGDIEVRVVDQPHGGITSAGMRFDSAAKSIGYSTDFNELTDDMKSLYENMDWWVVDALRRRPHPTHPHLDATLGWIAQCRVPRATLIHMDNSMDYASLAVELPAGVEPGYDGQEIEV
ncbi:MBL fold metallo-hydrolase [Stakelama tenebrarum]|uniref:MBL fold metallo-hydrolase n=1 Tax=Stakelama tenebrarum TaxID=2711215 RepID=A0A6G6Y5R4_9SPHN|nr:MBL fold metallo-hydrolase [Sphingosinithalassobacter tenebrarum]QIG80294.1 MBL fold metallo-hydrolase [Sphingosinithalassobacter tenebrarum]